MEFRLTGGHDGPLGAPRQRAQIRRGLDGQPAGRSGVGRVGVARSTGPGPPHSSRLRRTRRSASPAVRRTLLPSVQGLCHTRGGPSRKATNYFQRATNLNALRVTGGIREPATGWKRRRSPRALLSA
jgi:hypothetical protein